ncbi:MAG: hypothetical protein RBU21_15460 [FCB group bacterium]|jgi:hypothetical protein|nr:hypothetical protein [FCB group bacterium]
MSATLTQRIATFLHLGKMPLNILGQISSEGEILYSAEGIGETVILRSFRAPGHYASRRKMAFVGYFAITERRIVARAGAYNCIGINVSFDDPRFQQLEFKATEKYLCIAYDASIQADNMSGQVEIRLHLPDIDKAARILAEKGARIDTPSLAH